MRPVLDPTLKGDRPLGAGLLVHQGGMASRLLGGVMEMGGCERGRSSGLDVSLWPVVQSKWTQGCGFRAQKGPGLEIQPGELTEVDTWRVQGESYGKQTELEDMGIWGKADV